MLKNIREDLAGIKLSRATHLEKKIAECILVNYDKGVFINMHEVSQKCNVSESSVTKFSKRLGFSGFRELMLELKHEKMNYNDRSAFVSLTQTGALEIVKKFETQINNNNLFIDSFVKNIKSKKLYIFSSYETNDSAKFLYNILTEQLVDVIFIDIMAITAKMMQNLDKERILLVILVGLDNNYIAEHLQVIDKKILFNNLYLIASESQVKKVPVYKRLFIIKTEKYFGYLNRRIFFDYLFLSIYLSFIK